MKTLVASLRNVAAYAAACVLALVIASAADAQSITLLHSFSGTSDGALPVGTLILGNDGNFYGTASQGGGGGICSWYRVAGCGAVFKVTSTGFETVVYAFTGSGDGAFPSAELMQDSAGNLYGTTKSGGIGSSDPGCGAGCGTVFRIASDGTESILYKFAGGSDGAAPYSNLVEDSSGNLYGTTSLGGNTSCGVNGFGCGTVFKIATDGSKTILHAFAGGTDGATPLAGLVFDSSGNLYGTTSNFYNFSTGRGTVFKIGTDGTIHTLHIFRGGNDGAQPLAPVILDSAGNIYGTTRNGGGNTWCNQIGRAVGCGTVFEISPDRTETILYSFPAGTTDYPNGANPNAPVVLDVAGNLLGTTSAGGSYGTGTVFELTGAGSESKLPFDETYLAGNMEYPAAGLTILPSGHGVIGVTGAGPYCAASTNLLSCGIIFEVTR